MKKYIKQYDLPCYPDTEPKPGRRNIIGLERGVHPFRGFHKWMGGCGIGLIPTTVTQARAIHNLQEDVRLRLQHRVDETTRQLVWEQDQYHRWVEDPEQFAVPPEADK